MIRRGGLSRSVWGVGVEATGWGGCRGGGGGGEVRG